MFLLNVIVQKPPHRDRENDSDVTWIDWEQHRG